MQTVLRPPRRVTRVNPASNAAFARGIQLRRFLTKKTAFVRAKDRLIESHPTKRRACFNDFVETAMLAFTERNCLARAQIIAHDFSQELPSAALFRGQSLADDVAQAVGKPNTQLFFFSERK